MITENHDLREQVKRLRPMSVAVAFIGAGWKDYITVRPELRVVVSPGLGSNPRAIVELADALGWDNVLLLEDLHAKLYVGQDAVLIGSANLSRNAFEPGRQREVCVMLRDEESLSQAQKIFERYVSLARDAFPTEQECIDRVEKLRRQRRHAQAHGVPLPDSDERSGDEPTPEDLLPTFGHYRPDRDGRVLCAWYGPSGDYDYTDAVPVAVQEDIVYECHVAPDDLNPEDEWILGYRARVNEPHLTHLGHGERRPWLFYVHEVFENGCDEEGYETLCIQRESLRVPPKPFDESEPRFVDAFHDVMNREAFRSLRWETNEKRWRLREHTELNSLFFAALQEQYAALGQT
jgi:hypothetical protein